MKKIYTIAACLMVLLFVSSLLLSFNNNENADLIIISVKRDQAYITDGLKAGMTRDLSGNLFSSSQASYQTAQQNLNDLLKSYYYQGYRLTSSLSDGGVGSDCRVQYILSKN